MRAVRQRTLREIVNRFGSCLRSSAATTTNPSDSAVSEWYCYLEEKLEFPFSPFSALFIATSPASRMVSELIAWADSHALRKRRVISFGLAVPRDNAGRFTR